MTARPFVKWVGGKKQLLPEIRKKYPPIIERYCEPFVGGGAVLFDIISSFAPREVLINDINPELINAYRCVKECTDELIKVLVGIQREYYASQDQKGYYLEKRARFNCLIEKREDSIEKAALFIMLNKTCFNGLYRVNSHSLFNVPFNNSKKPLICDEENIRECGKLLENTTITLGDYSGTEDFIDDKTFVYIDPPYRPLIASSNFTSYNESGHTFNLLMAFVSAIFVLFLSVTTFPAYLSHGGMYEENHHNCICSPFGNYRHIQLFLDCRYY